MGLNVFDYLSIIQLVFYAIGLFDINIIILTFPTESLHRGVLIFYWSRRHVIRICWSELTKHDFWNAACVSVNTFAYI